MTLDDLQTIIRTVPDFPKPGIQFKDITPLLQNPEAYQLAIDAFIQIARDTNATVIAGIESRGFYFACPVATALGLPFIPIRKAGKLPWQTVSASYALEYGEAVIQVHTDAAAPNDRVLIIDDVLATGGTAHAAGILIKRLGASVTGYAFLMQLSFLDGAAQLTDAATYCLMEVTE